MPYPAYQCVKTANRDVYCSAKKVKNHDEGAAWVARAQAAHGFQANAILGRPYTEHAQPRNATIVD